MYLIKGTELVDKYRYFYNQFMVSLFNIKTSLLILNSGVKDIKEKKTQSYDILHEKNVIMKNNRFIKTSLDQLNVSITDIQSLIRLKDEPLNNLKNIIRVLDDFLQILMEQVIEPLDNHVSYVRKIDITRFEKEDFDSIYKIMLNLCDNGYRISIGCGKHLDKILIHLNSVRYSLGIEQKVQEILQGFRLDLISKQNKIVDIDTLYPNSSFISTLFDEKGMKVKDSFDPITKEDIKRYQSANMKYLYTTEQFMFDILPEQFHIVLIDDDSKYLEILNDWLVSLKFKVTTHSEPIKAFDVIRNYFPDLILLDINMKEMDGLQFLEDLKQIGNKGKDTNRYTPQKYPVIILSNQKEEESIRKAIQMGAIDFLEKPANFKEMSILRNILITKVLSTLRINYETFD